MTGIVIDRTENIVEKEKIQATKLFSPRPHVFLNGPIFKVVKDETCVVMGQTFATQSQVLKTVTKRQILTN